MTSLSSLVSLSVVGLCCQCCCLFVPCLSFPAFLCPLFRMLFGFPLGTTLGPCSYSGFTLIASCVVARGIVVGLCCLCCCLFVFLSSVKCSALIRRVPPLKLLKTLSPVLSFPLPLRYPWASPLLARKLSSCSLRSRNLINLYPTKPPLKGRL